MKRILPYIIAILLGFISSIIIIDRKYINLNSILLNQKNVTAFQIGVFTDLEVAKRYQELYKPSIIVKDDDIYRIYYSILSNKECVKAMEDYLTSKDINYYLKNFTITSSKYIKALDNYERVMIDSTNQTISAINELLLKNYEEAI